MAATNVRVGAIDVEFRRIQGTTFPFGSDRRKGITPRFDMEIVGSYEIMAELVTEELWREVMGTEPWRDLPSSSPFAATMRTGARYPAFNLTRAECVDFARRFGERVGATYTLPPESFWEHAARGGTATTYFWGEDPDAGVPYAWAEYDTDQDPGPCLQEVRRLKPNGYGLFDMAGLLEEFTLDLASPTSAYLPRAHYRSTRNWLSRSGPAVVMRNTWFTGSPFSLACDAKALRDADARHQPAGFRLMRWDPSLFERPKG